MTPGAKKFEAGCAAQKGRWDLSRLLPQNVTDPGNKSAFLQEALAHAEITGADAEIVNLLLSGYGIRQIAKIKRMHRVEIQKSVRKG